MLVDQIVNRDVLAVMGELPNDSLDIIVTDPPYLINYSTNYRTDKAHRFCSPIANDNNPELIENFIHESFRCLKENSALYMFAGQLTIDFFLKSLREAGFSIKNIIVWNKNNWTAGDLRGAFGRKWEPLILAVKGSPKLRGKRFHDVWDFPRVAGKAQLHQNQKPIELIERCIQTFSNEGDMVFDGFMGSGTTALAAKKNNRRFFGTELDSQFFDIAVKRISAEVV